MTWSLRYAASAARSLRKLDPQVQRRLQAALEELAENPERGKPLAIGHRRDVYDRVRRLLD